MILNRSNNQRWSELLDFLNTTRFEAVDSESAKVALDDKVNEALDDKTEGRYPAPQSWQERLDTRLPSKLRADFRMRTWREMVTSEPMSPYRLSYLNSTIYAEMVQAEHVRIFLVKCVDIISTVRLEWLERKNSVKDKTQLRKWEALRTKKLSLALSELWKTDLPLSESNAPRQVVLDVDPWGKLSAHSGTEHLQEFSFGNLVQLHEMISGYESYIMHFLEMLSDPKVGIARLVKCLCCGKIQIGRTNQKCCPDESGTTSCRVKWHYKQDPEKKKAQVKRWREKNPGMG